MKRYDGKNAIWFILFIILFNLIPTYLLIQSWGTLDILTIMISVMMYLMNFIFLPILFVNHVDLYDEYFVFYYGYWKTEVSIVDIKKMKKTRNPIASSANSLDRIYIETYNEELMISLKDNDGFIREVNLRKYALDILESK